MAYEQVIIFGIVGVAYLMFKFAEKVKDENQLFYVLFWHPLSMIFVPEIFHVINIITEELSGNARVITMTGSLESFAWGFYGSYLLLFGCVVIYQNWDVLTKKINEFFNTLKR